MKRFPKYFGLATTALALTLFAAAEDAPRNSASTTQLTAASATLQGNLDAKNAKQGDAVTAKLAQTVHLSGTTLPRNTVLVGHIDSVQPSENKGASKLVLTFDQAKLANGQQVAVKATLVGVYPEGTITTTPELNPELQVTQEPSGAHGYGLTSRVDGADSGTLSANGTNVRLTQGTLLQFAVAPAAAASSSAGN